MESRTRASPDLFDHASPSLALALTLALLAAPALAQEAPGRPSLEALERVIETRDPEVRVETPDHDRISARRIDVVDGDGVIRMTLAADTRAPIIDGVQYRRAFDVSGLRAEVGRSFSTSKLAPFGSRLAREAIRVNARDFRQPGLPQAFNDRSTAWASSSHV